MEKDQGYSTVSRPRFPSGRFTRALFNRMNPAGRMYPLVCLVLLTLAVGCAPVIETGADVAPLPIDAGIAYQQATIVLVTSQLESNPDRIDPVKLRESLEEQVRSSGVLAQSHVMVADGTVAADFPRIEVTLSRMEYSIDNLRMPPAPPCGFPLFAPIVAPALFQKNYLKHEAVVEGDVLFYDGKKEVVYRFFLSETATARANFFDSGGSSARARLVDIVLHNFSRRALREYLYLTRTGTIATVF